MRGDTGNGRRSRVPWRGAAVAGALGLLAAAAVGQAPPGGGGTASTSTPIPAEELRLPAEPFQKGLKQRGLTEILELHLREFPPASLASGLLIRRELKLAEAADPTLPKARQRAALAEANTLLETLIAQAGNDERVTGWRLELARSRVYDEAEPYFISILYRGGSAADRRQLQQIMEKVVADLAELTRFLEDEFARIDNLPSRDFEELERGGYIDALDRWAPQVEYLQLWAWYYDALPRADSDARRAGELYAILEGLQRLRHLWEKPQAGNPAQIPTLLLAGMTQRLLNDQPAARERLERTLDAARRLNDPPQAAQVEWAVRLAWIERVRTERDAGAFDRALNLLGQFRTRVAGASDNAGLQLVAALLERSVHQAAARQAEDLGRPADAQRHTRLAWESLARLARERPQQRNEIYATVCDLLDPRTPAANLDPFEQCARLAGLLFEAAQAPGDPTLERTPAGRTLQQALEVGEQFLRSKPTEAEPLVPEVLFNLGVAHYRRGQADRAAERFLAVARQYPQFEDALRAATLAVEVTAEQYRGAAPTARAAFRPRYLEALETLIQGYGSSEAAGYWRFYYGEVLEEVGRFEEAAGQYALLAKEHERFLESRFCKVRARVLAAQEMARRQPEKVVEVRRNVEDIAVEQQSLVADLTARLAQQLDAGDAAHLQNLRAQAVVLLAELQVTPAVGQAARVLAALEGFEGTHPDDPALRARVLRVRLLAYEQTGRLEEATRAVPAYIASDPEGAGATLQALYMTLAAERQRLEEDGRLEEARRKAEGALVLAEQVLTWYGAHAGAGDAAQERALRVQLAEAHLAAGNFERARDLFAVLREERAAGSAGAATQGADAAPETRVAYGYAEALYQLRAYELALPLFNRLATALPPEEPLRWQALLRDLQCRTALNEPGEDVVKVINQQEFLHPDLGGPRFAAELRKLRRENERRAGGD